MMRMKAFPGLALAVGILCLAVSGAIAQNPPSSPHHPGMGMMHGRHMQHHPAMSAPSAGSIIGDKHTKVYHMPGDKGMLPKEKNRVYFRTEAEAQTAGYHRAGGRHAMKPARRLPARDPKTGRFIKTKR